MKIGIDARMYGPEQGGLGRYIEQLIGQLEELDLPAEFIIFLRRENWDAYQPRAANFKKTLADATWYGTKEQLKLPSLIQKQRVDLMHFPHWNAPLTYRRPFVVTIHDLILWHFPDRKRGSTLGPWWYFLKYNLFKITVRSAARRARHILTTSEFTKQDIIKTLGVAADKITVTYQAPFPAIGLPTTDYGLRTTTKNSEARSLPTPYSLLLKLGINKPYALYVGVSFPHKNLEGLLRAWKMVEEKTNGQYQLALTGKRNYFYDQLLRSEAMKQCDNVIYTDFVPDASLPALYGGARLYVMPSRYEGFALPALEALAAGVPVAASNASCLPEVLGDAASYFNPTDTAKMAEVIMRTLTDENLRSILAKNRAAVLGRYSWKRLAETTWEMYKNSV